MTEEVQYVPGTELEVNQFATDFADKVTSGEDGYDASEADAWAREQLGGEPSDEQKKAVTPAILTKLDEKMKAEQATQATVSDSEVDSAEEGTTPVTDSENASESVTEAVQADPEAPKSTESEQDDSEDK